MWMYVFVIGLAVAIFFGGRGSNNTPSSTRVVRDTVFVQQPCRPCTIQVKHIYKHCKHKRHS
jgi:hypothetical protein